MHERTVGAVASVAIFAATLLVGSAPSADAAGWAQYGARVATWKAAHTLDKGCSLGPCYGPRVASAAQRFEFALVTTERGRVAGYDQALPNGTTQAEAALHALTLLPRDATMGSISVQHDRFGQSCAYVNFQSKTLKAWFGKNFLAGSGTVGVELVTVAGQGRVTYDPNRVNLVIVAPIYLGSGDNC